MVPTQKCETIRCAVSGIRAQTRISRWGGRNPQPKLHCVILVYGGLALRVYVGFVAFLRGALGERIELRIVSHQESP